MLINAGVAALTMNVGSLASLTTGAADTTSGVSVNPPIRETRSLAINSSVSRLEADESLAALSRKSTSTLRPLGVVPYFVTNASIPCRYPSPMTAKGPVIVPTIPILTACCAADGCDPAIRSTATMLIAIRCEAFILSSRITAWLADVFLLPLPELGDEAADHARNIRLSRSEAHHRRHVVVSRKMGHKRALSVTPGDCECELIGRLGEEARIVLGNAQQQGNLRASSHMRER